MTDRKLRLTNTTTNEVFDYELPDDLLYYDGENYDEFILDYDSQTCLVNKRVGYNADGTTYVLENEKTIEYEYPKIELTDGDYEISLIGYDNAYILVRLMAQNIYTTQFATRAEVNSEISQKADEIDLSVDKKLSNYSTTTQMNSAINQIKATKLATVVQEEVKEINIKAILISALIALVVLVIIIILVAKYVKRNSVPVVEYEYHDNLENKQDGKSDVEFSNEIMPETNVIKT